MTYIGTKPIGVPFYDAFFCYNVEDVKDRSRSTKFKYSVHNTFNPANASSIGDGGPPARAAARATSTAPQRSGGYRKGDCALSLVRSSLSLPLVGAALNTETKAFVSLDMNVARTSRKAFTSCAKTSRRDQLDNGSGFCDSPVIRRVHRGSVLNQVSPSRKRGRPLSTLPLHCSPN